MGSNKSLPTSSFSSSGVQRGSENETGGGEVRIDINPDHHSGQIITERVDRRRRSSSFDRATKMMIDMTLAIGGQTIGTVALTSCGGGGGRGPLYFVELSIIFGFSFIFAAISLRSKLPDVSTVMAKVGAIVIAVAIILSVTSHLPPILAFTAGPFALLIVSIAVAFAFTSSH